MSPFMTFRIAFKALGRNKMRTGLTMLGMIIGVSAVITLVAMGNGAQAVIEQQIKGAGTNMITVNAGNFTLGGARGGAGTATSLTVADAEAIRRDIPGVQYLAAGVVNRTQVVAANQNWYTRVQGTDVDLALIRAWPTRIGTFFSPQDVTGAAKVAVISEGLWTRLYEGSRIQELVETRESLLDVIVLVSVPIAIGLSVFAPEICGFLGPGYLASATVLRIIAYRALLAVVDGLVGHGFLIAINQVRKRQRSQLIALLVLAAMTLALGRWWGPQGVAIALFVSDTILIAQYYRILSKLNLHIRTRFFVPVCAAGGCMALISLMLPNGLGLATRVIAGLLAYACALFALSGSRVLGVIRTVRHCLGGFAPTRTAEVAQ